MKSLPANLEKSKARRKPLLSLILCLLMFRILFTCPLYSQESMEQSWETLKQLQVRQEIQVVDMNLKSLKGTLVGVSNEAISLRVENDEIAIQRANVLRVSLREKPNRSRNALIGLGMGAAAGLVAIGSLALALQAGGGPASRGPIGPANFFGHGVSGDRPAPPFSLPWLTGPGRLSMEHCPPICSRRCRMLDKPLPTRLSLAG